MFCITEIINASVNRRVISSIAPTATITPYLIIESTPSQSMWYYDSVSTLGPGITTSLLTATSTIIGELIQTSDTLSHPVSILPYLTSSTYYYTPSIQPQTPSIQPQTPARESTSIELYTSTHHTSSGLWTPSFQLYTTIHHSTQVSTTVAPIISTMITTTVLLPTQSTTTTTTVMYSSRASSHSINTHYTSIETLKSTMLESGSTAAEESMYMTLSENSLPATLSVFSPTSSHTTSHYIIVTSSTISSGGTTITTSSVSGSHGNTYTTESVISMTNIQPIPSTSGDQILATPIPVNQLNKSKVS